MLMQGVSCTPCSMAAPTSFLFPLRINVELEALSTQLHSPPHKPLQTYNLAKKKSLLCSSGLHSVIRRMNRDARKIYDLIFQRWGGQLTSCIDFMGNWGSLDQSSIFLNTLFRNITLNGVGFLKWGKFSKLTAFFFSETGRYA